MSGKQNKGGQDQTEGNGESTIPPAPAADQGSEGTQAPAEQPAATGGDTPATQAEQPTADAPAPQPEQPAYGPDEAALLRELETADVPRRVVNTSSNTRRIGHSHVEPGESYELSEIERGESRVMAKVRHGIRTGVLRDVNSR